MRPGQQNNNKNRSRGRNNNGGRKHVNPLSRNYESNGPDVKVRGNAAHIAEKYVQLARDAQASGDSVMAENYYQHAEHYFRIVMAAQPPGTVNSQFAQDFDSDEDDLDTVDVDQVEPGNRAVAAASADEQPASGAAQPEARAQRDEQPRERLPREERQRRREHRAPRGERPAEAGAEDAAPPVAAEPVAVEAVPVEPVTSEPGVEAVEAEPKRARRPRRPRRAAGEADPAEAAQSDVGELPAFITAGGTAAE